MPKYKAIFILNAKAYEQIYGAVERVQLEEAADFVAAPQTSESIRLNPELLRDVQVIFSGWGAPVMDEEFLSWCPNLEAVFYGAGSVRGFVTEALWKRGIIVSSAYAANALPVAEYTLATIILSLKHFWQYARAAKQGCEWAVTERGVAGGFRSTVGMISLGAIARRTLQLLEPLDHRKLVYCPLISKDEADSLDVELVTLMELFRQADVVSLHTPDLPETRGLIQKEHFLAMKRGATFINTARGVVVNEAEMIEALRLRPDLTAILDVTHPEPPQPDSPLMTLPNVVLTPHMAGSVDRECERMGRYMLEEFRRYCASEPLHWQITAKLAANMA